MKTDDSAGVAGGLELSVAQEPYGRTRLTLSEAGARRCRLTIDRYAIHDGRGGVLAMDGIGNVLTEPEARGQGLAARLMDIALERMRAGDADVSMLYGIDGFYHRWGYADCGDEHWLELVLVPQWGRDNEVGGLPPGWGVRDVGEGDLPTMAALYERIAAAIPGAAARPLDGRTWSRLREGPDDDCRIVTDAAGELAGWVWRGREIHDVRSREETLPTQFVAAELQARDVEAAGAVIGAARSWAVEAGAARDEPYVGVLTGSCPGHAIHAAAQAHHARFTLERRPQGGTMLVQLRSGAPQLAGCYQFLPDRF